jgi:CubicO group peptidase (beta-lactamase class C family)
VITRLGSLSAPGFRTTHGAAANLMYFLAGQVAEQRIGLPLADALAARLFGPLGMTRTSARGAEALASNDLARPHRVRDGVATALEPRAWDHFGGAGAVFSTAGDLAQWLRFQLAGGLAGARRLVHEETLRETHRAQNILAGTYQAAFNPGATMLGYGFGWVSSDYRGTALVEHGGSVLGYTAMIAMLPERRLGVVILSNLNADRALMPLRELKFALLEEYLP